MKQGQIEFYGTTYKVEITRYVSGGTALQIFDAEEGFPAGTITVNVPGVQLPSERHVIIKEYDYDGILEALEAANIVKRTGDMVRTGFVRSPVAELVLQAPVH